MSERLRVPPRIYASFVAQLMEEGMSESEAHARARGLFEHPRLCDINAQRTVSRSYMKRMVDELASSRGEWE